MFSPRPLSPALAVQFSFNIFFNNTKTVFIRNFHSCEVEQRTEKRDFNILLLKPLIKRLQMLSGMNKEICGGECIETTLHDFQEGKGVEGR